MHMISSFINLRDKEKNDILRMQGVMSNKAARIRCRIILLRDAHMDAEDVATNVNRSSSYVYQVCRYFNRYGIGYLRGDKDYRKQYKK